MYAGINDGAEGTFYSSMFGDSDGNGYYSLTKVTTTAKGIGQGGIDPIFESVFSYSTYYIPPNHWKYGRIKWNIEGRGKMKGLNIIGEAYYLGQGTVVGEHVVTADIQPFATAIGCKIEELIGFYLME